MTSFTTERTGDTITITPKNEASQSALVVISHGLGDTAEGFADVAEHLAEAMPYAKFILPTAPTQPVTINMGASMPSWFDITGLDERSNEECKGLSESQATIQNILNQEHASTRLPYNRMVLMGFSQGGGLSLYTGMQMEEKLAGIVMMSAYLPSVKTFNIGNGNHDTPILHCHGTADPIVPLHMAQKSQKLLLEKGATNYKLESYEGLQHTVLMKEIADILGFLQTILPPDESCKIELKDPSEMSVKELKAAIRKAGLGRQAVGLMEKGEFVRLLQDHRAGGN